jgi:RimJ/RimL family protein N-acetyltransferase
MHPPPSVRIREIRDGDEDAIARLLGDLDPESCRRRWFGAVDVRRAAGWAAHPERVSAVGLLAFAGDELVGHAALVPLPDGRGEVAFEVAAPWRHHGIAGALLERLITAAGARGLREVYAEVLPENADMLAVLREHGRHGESREGGVVSVTIPVAHRSDPAENHGRAAPVSPLPSVA